MKVNIYQKRHCFLNSILSNLRAHGKGKGLHTPIFLPIITWLLDLAGQSRVGEFHVDIDWQRAWYPEERNNGSWVTHYDFEQRIWNHRLLCKITFTPDYISSAINIEAKWELQQTRDCSKWKWNLAIFEQLCQIRGAS